MPKDNPLMQGLKQAAVKPKEIAPPRSEQKPSGQRVPSRVGTKLVGGHFAEDVSVALKVIAAENRTTVQKLLAEGINAVFAKYQKPQIADISAGV